MILRCNDHQPTTVREQSGASTCKPFIVDLKIERLERIQLRARTSCEFSSLTLDSRGYRNAIHRHAKSDYFLRSIDISFIRHLCCTCSTSSRFSLSASSVSRPPTRRKHRKRNRCFCNWSNPERHREPTRGLIPNDLLLSVRDFDRVRCEYSPNDYGRPIHLPASFGFWPNACHQLSLPTGCFQLSWNEPWRRLRFYNARLISRSHCGVQVFTIVSSGWGTRDI